MMDEETDRRMVKVSAALDAAKPQLCRRSRTEISNRAWEAIHGALYADPPKCGSLAERMLGKGST